jgi:hypothetical protein
VADQDSRFAKAISCAISNLRPAGWWCSAYLHAVGNFLNETSPEEWKLHPLLSDLKCTDPHVVQVGWFVYQRALALRNPNHQWNSQFDRETKLPVIGRRASARVELSLSDSDLINVEARARSQLAVWDRHKLLQELKNGTVSLEEAGAKAKEKGWAPVPAELADSLELPNQPWLALNEAIVALIIGRPDNHWIIDCRMANDFIDLAKHALIDAVSKDIVHLHGKQDPHADGLIRIDFTLFRRKVRVLWRSDRIEFFRPDNPNHLVPQREPPMVWHDVHAEVETIWAWWEHRSLATSTPSTTPNPPSKSVSMTLAEMKRRFKTEITRQIANGERSSLTQNLEFLRTLRPRTNRDQAADLRREIVPNAWKRSGRPSTRPQKISQK